MKTCSKCGKELSLDNFYKTKGFKDGLCSMCKRCHNEHSKAYRKANPEKGKARKAAYSKSNPEKIKAYNAAWYEANKEKTKARSAAWHKANPEMVKAAKEKWSKANSEQVKTARKAYREANPEKIKAQRAAFRNANPEYMKVYKKAWREANHGYETVYQATHRLTRLDEERAATRAWRKANPEKVRQYCHEFKARRLKLPHTLTLAQWEQIKKDFNNACCYCGEEKPLAQEHFLALSKGGEYSHSNIIPACRSCNSSKSNKDFFEWYPNFRNYSKAREKVILDFLN